MLSCLYHVTYEMQYQPCGTESRVVFNNKFYLCEYILDTRLFWPLESKMTHYFTDYLQEQDVEFYVSLFPGA